MKAFVIDLMIAAFLSSCAQMLVPEGEMKSGAEKLIAFAAAAAVLMPVAKLFIRFLRGGK